MREQPFQERLAADVPMTSYGVRYTMNQMDRCSQEAFEKITVYAGVLQEAFAGKPAVMAMLEMLQDTAADAQNHINALAEDYEAHYREAEQPWPLPDIDGKPGSA